MSTPSTLGQRIAQARRDLAARKQRDVGQADIAKAVHATATSVSEWEADKKVPRERTLNKVAAFLEVTPAYLRYGVTEKRAPTAAEALANAEPGEEYVPATARRKRG